MKARVIVAIIGLFLFVGCYIHGEGTYKGYVLAVEDGLVWNHVYVKTDLQSSDSDGLMLSQDASELKSQLLDAMESQEQVTIRFARHLAACSAVPAREVLAICN